MLREGSAMQLLRLKYLVAACLLTLTVGAAQAATETFNVDATWYANAYNFSGPVTGTMTFDTTADLVVAADLTMLREPWSIIGPQGPDRTNPSLYDVDIATTVYNQGFSSSFCPGASPLACHDAMLFVLSTDPATIGNNGYGTIVGGGGSLADVAIWGVGNITGTLLPTPLPATVWLFMTGVAGMGLLGWRRKRAAAGRSGPAHRRDILSL
jgi:hypothetical protein